MGKSTELYRIIKDTRKNDLIKYAKETCKHGHSLIAHPKCLREMLDKRERVAIFDIEMTGSFNAIYGKMFCYAFKEIGNDKVISNSITSAEAITHNPDERLCYDLVHDLSKFDKIITYYGTKHDGPFTRSRVAYHMSRSKKKHKEYPVFQQIKHHDLYYTVKAKLSLPRRSLYWACKLYNIESKSFFTSPEVSAKANVGDKKSLKFIEDHCIEDVIVTEKLFHKIKDYVGPKNNSL